MNHMTGTPTQDFKDGNKLEFVVLRKHPNSRSKAFEDHFEVKVERVWTKTRKDGKRAHPTR